jgi:hypothetical protein
MKLNEAFLVLRSRFGTHAEAARSLGLSVRSYTQYRSGHCVPTRVARYIRCAAWAVQSGQNIDDLEFLDPGPPHRPVDGTKKGASRGIHDGFGESMEQAFAS